MAKPSIMIGTPCFGGMVTKDYTVSLMQAVFACHGAGIGVNVNLLGGDALIPRARSHITCDFLDKPDLTHLLFLDADISFAPDQLMRLIEFDQDVVAAMYPLKNVFWNKIPGRMAQGEPVQEAGLLYTASLCAGAAARTEQGFATAEVAATGFLLIKRQVFTRMIAAYPETKFDYLDMKREGQPKRENLYALYDTLVDPETRAYMSEDYAFCRRWRAIGGEIWVDLHSKLTHEGSFKFEGNTARRYGAGPG